MKTIDLSPDQVRDELNILIRKYPNRTGQLDNYTDQFPTCVYYTDSDGVPITPDEYDFDGLELFDIPLVTPVCLIGQWIEDFHPELKNIESIRLLLVQNKTVGTLYDQDNPFPSEVSRVLAEAQRQQDEPRSTWGDIDLTYN